MRRIVLPLGMLIILLLLVAVVAGFRVAAYWTRPLPLQQSQVVTVDPGSSYSGMLHDLQRAGLLGTRRQALLRRVAARLYAIQTGIDQRLYVGEYRLRPGDSLKTLLEKVDRGEVVQHDATLVDGWTFKEWRHSLDQLGELKHASEGLTGKQIMARLGLPDYKAEGWFAPNTYFYTRGTSDLDLMRRALDRQRQILQQAWAARQEGLPYKKPYQALIMASIVEKETADPSERDKVAAVFVNRLRLGMRLQTDPTVIYGMGSRYKGKLSRADLRRPTPYNTYQIDGLPPTPIAMPGKASIEAALHPADTKALYFVARGDGSHEFSRTLAAHRRAVREYQLHRRADYRSTPAPVGSSTDRGDSDQGASR